MRVVYSVVRFVPDPARGEFVNVAAIAGSEDSSEWQVRQVENPQRARALDQRGALDGVWGFLGGVGRDIDRFEAAADQLLAPERPPSETWLRDLSVRLRHVVQLSPPAPVVADSVDQALDRVFEELIVDPARARFPFQKKHAALAALRQAYSRVSITKRANLREGVGLETDRFETVCDFAVSNGAVVQLAQAWSFQIPDQPGLAQQVKAWGWTVREVRERGGRVRTPDGAVLQVPADADVRVVYVAPGPDREAPALREARAVFAELDVVAVPVAAAAGVAVAARERLVQAGVRLEDLRDA